VVHPAPTEPRPASHPVIGRTVGDPLARRGHSAHRLRADDAHTHWTSQHVSVVSLQVLQASWLSATHQAGWVASPGGSGRGGVHRRLRRWPDSPPARRGPAGPGGQPAPSPSPYPRAARQVRRDRRRGRCPQGPVGRDHHHPQGHHRPRGGDPAAAGGPRRRGQGPRRRAVPAGRVAGHRSRAATPASLQPTQDPQGPRRRLRPAAARSRPPGRPDAGSQARPAGHR
jgi:hypothetical protein